MSPATSYARLSYGLKHYTDSLRRYIERRVREDWWEEYVRTSLPDEQIAILDRERRQHADDVDEAREGVLPKSGVEFLDARHFAAIFSERFRAGEEITQLMRQVQEAQRRWADPPEGDYPAEEVDQALDAMHDTLAYYQLPAAAEIEALREGGDVPESAYVRLSEELKRHSDGMHRTFRDWAERESPAEWWEQRIGEQRRAALDRYVGDTSRLTTEELIGLLGPADLTAIVLDNCDLSGQERWLLRTVFRVRRNWAHPASGEFPDSYVTEASEWMHEVLDTVTDAIDELLEPAPDSEAAMDAPAEEEPAQEQQRSRAASVGDYFTCGVVVAFAGALVLAVILVGLALLGTRTWPVDRALDASGAAAGAVGEFVDGITGTSPPEATATPVASATSTPAPRTPTATSSPTASATPAPTSTAAPTPTPTSTPTATQAPQATTPGAPAIGNTDGDGVSLRDDCEDGARISAPGQGWPEGQEIEVVEVGSGRCEGWILAQAGDVASWVRVEYVVGLDE